MKKYKIVADDKLPFLKGVLEEAAVVVYLPGAKTTATDVRDADALITRTRTRCCKGLLENSRVKCVATATIGYDHINTDDMAALGIPWSNAPGCNAASVAQYITSVLVSFPGSRAGETLGVIGVGHVGKLVAAAGKALGMRVLLNDPPRAEAEGETGFVSLDRIREEADFVTLHVPLEREGKYPTFKMLGKSFFEGMKKSAVFINSSRGEAVENNELKEALKNGCLKDIVLDVWENEPDIDRELMTLARFATPHIAGYSTDGKANGTSMSVQRVARALGLAALENWRPAQVPAALVSQDILLDEKQPEPDQIRKAVLHTYNVSDDDWKLKSFPEQFEKLRGNYFIRREFPAYSIRGGSAGARQVLADLGFILDGGK